MQNAATPTTRSTNTTEMLNAAATMARSTPGTSNEHRDRVHHGNATCSRIMFRILSVKLFGNNKIIETFTLLNEGSAITILWFGNKCASEESKTVSLGICGIGCSLQKFDLLNVRTVRRLDLPTQSVNMSDLKNRMQQLCGLAIHDYLCRKYSLDLTTFISASQLIRSATRRPDQWRQRPDLVGLFMAHRE